MTTSPTINDWWSGSPLSSTRSTHAASPTRTETALATCVASSTTSTTSSPWVSTPCGSHRGTPPPWLTADTTSATTATSTRTLAPSPMRTPSWHRRTSWVCGSSSISSRTTPLKSIHGSKRRWPQLPAPQNATATSFVMAGARTVNFPRTTGRQFSAAAHGSASPSRTALPVSVTYTFLTFPSPTGTGRTPTSSKSLTGC